MIVGVSGRMVLGGYGGLMRLVLDECSGRWDS